MGWNGSKCQSQANMSHCQIPKRRPFGVFKGIFAGLVVVLVGVAVFCIVGRKNAGDPPVSDAPIKNARVKPVEPSKAAKQANPKVEATTNAIAKPAPKPMRKTYVDGNGVERYEGGLRVVKHWPKPPADQMNTNKHLFKHSAELQIQWLLETEPGEFMLDIPYDERFDRSLAQSFKEEIVFLPEDTPEERKTKEDVIAAKAELKAAMDRGEKAYQVMNEARSELLRLYRYRDNIEKEVRRKRDSGEMSEADVKEYIAAANALLERNGIKPLKMNSVSTRLLLQKMRGKAK